MKTLMITGLLSSLMMSTSAMAQDSSKSIVEDGKFLFNSRLRHESVSQDNLNENANATTFRARVGYQSGTYKGFSFLVEGEGILDLMGDYNDTKNGMAAYPVVADPQDFELNRAQVNWKFGEKSGVSVGRQILALGNQRLLGHVGFRQNIQTFDAIAFNTKALDKLDFTYAYVNQVNRIFGDSHPNPVRAQLNGDVHALFGKYSAMEGITLIGQGLFADVDEGAGSLSTKTIGARLETTHKFESTTLKTGFEYNEQRDYADNPMDFAVNYFAGEISLSGETLAGKLGIESLGGDGVKAFSTPLATLHKFQGFADVFLTTPANGINDIYGQLTVKAGDFVGIKGLTINAWYHDFSVQNGSGSLGTEIDLAISGKITKEASFEIKLADYNGVEGYAGRSKVWFTLGYVF